MSKSWFDTLEKAQVIIYRRPNFLADDFEYEQYMGTDVLRNLFHEKKVKQDTDIFLCFPERWINSVECHQLFPRLEKYYPNLKTLTIKTHAPLIITGVPNGYAFLLTEENEITRISNGSGSIDAPTSIEDPEAIFKGISKGKLFCSTKEKEFPQEVGQGV